MAQQIEQFKYKGYDFTIKYMGSDNFTHHYTYWIRGVDDIRKGSLYGKLHTINKAIEYFRDFGAFDRVIMKMEMYIRVFDKNIRIKADVSRRGFAQYILKRGGREYRIPFMPSSDYTIDKFADYIRNEIYNNPDKYKFILEVDEEDLE